MLLPFAGMYLCANNKIRPQDNQHLTLRFYRDIALPDMQMCLDAHAAGDKKPIVTGGCHAGQGNQYFRYDLDNNHIYHGSYANQNCVEADTAAQTVYVTKCDPQKDTQKFKWGFVNETNIRNWLTYGSKIVHEQEILDLQKLKQ
jgi:hypothetical protein